MNWKSHLTSLLSISFSINSSNNNSGYVFNTVLGTSVNLFSPTTTWKKVKLKEEGIAITMIHLPILKIRELT